MQMIVGQLRHAAAARRARQKADLHQIRLVDILERHGFLADGRRQRLQTDRPAAVIADNGRQHPAIDGVETQIIDLEPSERVVGRLAGDDAVIIELREVAHTPKRSRRGLDS